MKNIIAIFLCAIVIASASAQVFSQEKEKTVSGFCESETTVSQDAKPNHQLNCYVTKKLTEKWGLYGWGQTSRSYSQAYGGVTFSPTTWAQVGLAAGVEQAKKKGRIAGFVWTGKKKVSNLLIVETGGSGTWFKETLSYQATKRVAVSFVSQRFLATTGFGVDVSLGKGFTAYAIGGRDLEFQKTRGAFGIRKTF